MRTGVPPLFSAPAAAKMTESDMDSDIPRAASVRQARVCRGRSGKQPADAAGKFPVFVGRKNRNQTDRLGNSFGRK